MRMRSIVLDIPEKVILAEKPMNAHSPKSYAC